MIRLSDRADIPSPADAAIARRSPRGRAASESDPGVRGSRFFARSAILVAALVLLSFPLTYFIALATGSRAFTLLHHVHGLAFFAWVGLYLLQTRLVRMGRLRLHREIGIAGVALAGAMLPLGLWMAVTAAGSRQARGLALPFEFSLSNLADIVIFSSLFGWAIHDRGICHGQPPAGSGRSDGGAGDTCRKGAWPKAPAHAGPGPLPSRARARQCRRSEDRGRPDSTHARHSEGTGGSAGRKDGYLWWAAAR